MLLRRTARDVPLLYDDVVPLCRRCCQQVERAADAMTAPGQTRATMPRQLVIDRIIGDLTHGRTPLDPDHGVDG